MEKEKAKVLGACWDPMRKRWYIPLHLSHETKSFSRWLPKEDKDRIKKEEEKIAAEKTQSSEPELNLKIDGGEKLAAEQTQPSEPELNFKTTDTIDEHVVFYDIETTGLFSAPTVGDVPHFQQLHCFHNCRIVQMSYVVCNKSTLDIIEVGNHIIQASDFDIGNSEFHGITKEISLSSGIPFSEAALKFLHACSNATHLLAHNSAFDVVVTQSELYRSGLADLNNALNSMEVICTMKKTKELVKATDKLGRIKNPKLKELYEFATNRKIQNEHDSLFDTLNLYEAIKALVNSGQLK